MYDWLLRFLSPRCAGLALVLWYAALFAAVVILSGSGIGDFRYGRL
jgi:hypothetical protein